MNEIQRKFLVSPDIKRWLKQQVCSTEKLERFYAKPDKATQDYYLRKYPDTYSKVIVSEDTDEEFISIDEDEYRSARKDIRDRRVVKKSHTVLVDKVTFVVFEYLKTFEGMYILHVYTNDDRSMRESDTLESLQPFILKEIDKDTKYSDSSLCLNVKPMEYDITKLFEKIDAFEASNLFFWQVPRGVYIRDGVTLVLYKNLRLLNHYKVNYQNKHFSATLHRLRVLMRRTATILDTFSHLFNPRVQRFCTNLLLRYHDETKLLRYLYFLEELCSTRDNATLTLHSELKTLTSEEENLVLHMLLSQPFIQLIQILTRELYEQGYEQYKPLRKEVKKAVKKHLKTFESLLQSTKDGYDDEVLEALYTSMDSLQTLLEDFFHVIGEKKTQMIVDEINILLKPLREYRNCKERAQILAQLKEQAEYATVNVDTLLCENIHEIEDKIARALKLLRSSKFYL